MSELPQEEVNKDKQLINSTNVNNVGVEVPSGLVQTNANIKPASVKKISKIWWFYFGFVTITILFLLIQNIIGSKRLLLSTPGVPLISILILNAIIISPFIIVSVIITLPLFVIKHKPKLAILIWLGFLFLLSIFFTFRTFQSVFPPLYESYSNNKNIETPLTKAEALSLIHDCKVSSIKYSEDNYLEITTKIPDYGTLSGIVRFTERSNYKDVRQAVKSNIKNCDIYMSDEVTEMKTKSITYDQAVDLMNSCQVYTLYTDTADEDLFSKANSQIGLVLQYQFEEIPGDIYLSKYADKTITSDLNKIAEKVNSKCEHFGSSDSSLSPQQQKKYREDLNSPPVNLTEDEAIKLLQSCKVRELVIGDEALPLMPNIEGSATGTPTGIITYKWKTDRIRTTTSQGQNLYKVAINVNDTKLCDVYASYIRIYR